MEKFTIAKNEDIAWCPGCGNFTLLKIIGSLSTVGVKNYL